MSVGELDVTVSGTVSGDVDIARVSVCLEGSAPQPEQVATRNRDLVRTLRRPAGQPDNQHYRPVARVELSGGGGRSAVGTQFALGDPIISDSATFSDHIVAGRIALQRPPCAAGFGVCDAHFNSLFFQFGMNPFALHASSSSGPWFVDPSHIAGLCPCGGPDGSRRLVHRRGPRHPGQPDAAVPACPPTRPS